MVQQTTDSKFREYGLANSETGIPKYDRQLPVSLVSKKTALRDFQNENTNMVPKSDGSSLLKQNGPAVEATKVSGSKRPQPESPMKSPSQQTTRPSSNGHLVYVRRKTESEQHKNNPCIKTNEQPQKLCEHDDKKHEEATICVQKDVLESNSVPSMTPFDSIKSNATSPVVDSNHLQLENQKRLLVQNWEERFCRLQNYLRVLDQSNQDDYRQMLRSLSSVDLSRIAVELEKRSIRLTLEEAKEVQRAQHVDILDQHRRPGEENKPMN